MKMYLLYEWHSYEGEVPHSIWEEKELAEMWAQAFNEEMGGNYYGWGEVELQMYPALKENEHATV